MSSPTVATLDPQLITVSPIILPSQRRLMIMLMLALTALLHLATSGWGPIENGPDGMNAAVARELALGRMPSDIGHLWNQPVETTPKQWITAQSFRIFKVNEFAARLPFAIANLLTVAMVFLIAERIGGVWRGLASGIIAATMSGTILQGRDGGGEAFTALVLTMAIYAAIRMLEQKSPLFWQVFYWFTVAALLAMGKPAATLLITISLWMAFVFFREARLRLRPIIWIIGNGLLLGILVIFFREHLLVTLSWEIGNAARYLGALFPWSVVILPPLLLRSRKVLRLHELTPAESILWSLFILGSLWVLTVPSMQVWPTNIACLTLIFALLASLVWERTSSQIRMVGVAVLVGLAFFGMGFSERIAGQEWLNLLQPIWWLSLGVIIIFGVAAMVSLYLRHSRAALLIIAAATIPLAYNLLDARARHGWQNSLKDFGQKVELGYMPETQIYVDENIENVSSFLFYAPHGLRIHPTCPEIITRTATNNYLLVSQKKMSVWPESERVGNNRSYVLLMLPKK